MASLTFYCPHCMNKVRKPDDLREIEAMRERDPGWRDRREQLRQEAMQCPHPDCNRPISVLEIVEGKLDTPMRSFLALVVSIGAGVGVWALCHYVFGWNAVLAGLAALPVLGVLYAVTAPSGAGT